MDRSHQAWNHPTDSNNGYLEQKANGSHLWAERPSRQRMLSQSSDVSNNSGNDTQHSFYSGSGSNSTSDMSKSFYSAPNETRPSRTAQAPSHGPAGYNSMPDSPASFLSFEAQQKMGHMKGLDQDDLLGGQREGGSAYTTSASSRSDPDFRFSQDSGSALGSSPPSAGHSDSGRSTHQGSPPLSGSQKAPHPLSLQNSPNPDRVQRPSAIQVPSYSNGLPATQESGSYSSTNSHLSPLSPLVQPFSPSAAPAHSSTTSERESNSSTSQITTQDLNDRASTSSFANSSQQLLHQSSYNNQFYPYRNDGHSGAPSSIGSPPLSSTMAPRPISESVANTAAELGPPGSLNSTAFASLGAQLGLSGPGALASLAQSRSDAVPGSSTSASGAEEISTIFVVGFPEDMHEREFQNMFIFAPGFEAATLKGPSSSSMGPIANASSNQKGPFSPTMINSPLSPYNQEGYNSMYAYESSQYDDVRDSSLSQMLRDQASGMSRESSTNTATARKLTIGFAKFRTRQQALDAREVLSGRRVDADRDCVLKAEMAKKNLHTKRGLANGAPATDGSSVGVGNTTGNASLPPSVMALGQHNLAVAAAAALNPQFLANALNVQARDGSISNPNSARQQSPVSNTNNQLGVAALLRERDQEPSQRDQRNNAFDAFHSVPPSHLSPAYTHHSRTAEGSAVAAADPRYNAYVGPSRNEMSPGMHELSSSSASVAPGISNSSSYYRGPSSMPGPYNRMNQEMDDSNRRSAIGQTPDGYTQHSFYGKGNEEAFANRNGYYQAGPASTSLSSRFHGMHINTSSGSGMRPTSPPSASGMTSPRGSNPADQNPPINTLYVGGLPAVLPSLTGPMSASHLEDSLRAVFSRSPGFKRLCFRQKSNGPMSFIEYENVEYATRALSDLYGHTLGGLVKGGIRLSYSKNPLGVRSNSVSQGGFSSSGPLSPGLNGYGADAFSLTPTSANARRPNLDPFYQPQSAGYRSMTPRSSIASPTSAFSGFGEPSY